VEYLTSREMAEEERRAAERGVTVEAMMEKAGLQVARVVNDRYGPLAGRKVVVFCGSGNNGGDGFVAARHMADMGASVTVVLLADPGRIRTPEARANWDRLSGVDRRVVVTKERLLELAEIVSDADVIVDAIFGTGVRDEIGEPYRSAIEMINGAGAPKVAVDIPSGLDPDTGAAADPTVLADVTVTLHRPKVGLRDRVKYTGEVVVVPIGIE
jgi:hydroxyethylthiazole kinase-like uncharacterized protein yjeF